MSSCRKLAAAFDLGTTTIAASLLDVASGERLATAGALNPQKRWGADVLARLKAASDQGTLAEIQRCTALELERLTLELLSLAGAAENELDQVAVAGNPAMEHLLLGLPVERLVHPPYLPLFRDGRSVSTKDLGWSRALPAFLFPLPGGFVGGDLVAFLHALPTPTAPVLYLDLGTNGEIALFDGERFLATSAAAGPAFEGGNLSCGMAALPGAICGVEIEGERLKIRTIGDAPVAGICGSGVLECVAALLDSGILDKTGRLLSPDEIPSNLGTRVTAIDGDPAFVLHRDARRTVYLGQEDIRALQLAKGALRGGVEVLLSRAGVSYDDLSEVVLTGSFGAVLSPGVLKKIGVFSEKMVIITGFIREGALAGVERFLSEEDGPARLEALAAKVRVIPLSGTPLFEKLFIKNIDFP